MDGNDEASSPLTVQLLTGQCGDAEVCETPTINARDRGRRLFDANSLVGYHNSVATSAARASHATTAAVAAAAAAAAQQQRQQQPEQEDNPDNADCIQPAVWQSSIMCRPGITKDNAAGAASVQAAPGYVSRPAASAVQTLISWLDKAHGLRVQGMMAEVSVNSSQLHHHVI
jgi:hypothetical protein